MSIRAINWAMYQVRTDGPSAQAVMFVIADASDPEGVCRHADPKTIAERTRQSEATVYRRLSEVERAGAIIRHTIYGERGERRFEIRCQLHRTIDYSSVDELPPLGTSTEAAGDSQIESLRLSPVRVADSHSCESQEESYQESEGLPPVPPSGGGIEQPNEDETSEASPPLALSTEIDLQGLDAYRSTYPIPTNHPERLQATWGALSAEERYRCQRGAAGARRHWDANAKRRPSLLDSAKFAASPLLWDEYARFAPPEPRAIVKLAPGSTDYQALQLMREIAGSASVAPEMLGPVPEGGAALAALRDPDAQWVAVAEGTPQCGRWRGLLKAWLARDVECYRIFLDADGHPVAEFEDAAMETITVNGRPISVRKRITGLRVPREWPPALRTPPVPTTLAADSESQT